MKRTQFRLCAALVVVLTIGGSAWAQLENVALDTGLWSDASNWSLGTVPTTADLRAFIWSQDTVTVDYAAPDIAALRLGSYTSHRGKVEILAGASLRNQGQLQISGGHTLSGKSRVNVAGTFINDGVMDVGHVNGSTQPGGALQVLSGGAVTANNTVNIGLGAQGFVEITGGTFTQVGNYDTFVGAGSGMAGQLFMDGGTYKTGDDLILAGNGINRIGTVDLNGGAYLDITDDLFGSLNTSTYSGSAAVIVSDAEMRVNDSLYLGRYQTATLTLDDADADVNAWQIHLAQTSGTAAVNLFDGVLTVRGNNLGDNLLTIGTGGSIDFEKGVLEYYDNTTTDELEAWWADSTFTATKNGANSTEYATLDSITYTQDLGDGYTAVVGLDGAVAKTFVIPEPATVGLLGMSGIFVWIRRRLMK